MNAYGFCGIEAGLLVVIELRSSFDRIQGADLTHLRWALLNDEISFPAKELDSRVFLE